MNRQLRRHPTHPALPILYPEHSNLYSEKKRVKSSSSSKRKLKLRRTN